jgi:hypothetical protein
MYDSANANANANTIALLSSVVFNYFSNDPSVVVTPVIPCGSGQI